MIQHWLSEKGLKAIQIMPKIEWETAGGFICLLYHHTHHNSNKKPCFGIHTRCKEGSMEHTAPTSAHIALCLLQHQATKRLSALGTLHLNLYEDESCSIWIEIEEDNMAVPLYDGGGENFDEALINAVLSTEKK